MSAMQQLQAPLDVLALFTLADEFYTKDERMNVYAEYERLLAAEKEAFELLKQARKPFEDDAPSWEQRVAEYGEATAKEQFASFRAAGDNQQSATRAAMAFRKEHALLLRLFDARDAFGKNDRYT